MTEPQDDPIAYFPISSKPFEFKAGLKRLPAEGAATAAEKVFQIDNQWQAYRDAKLASRAERLEKYVCEKRLSDDARSRITAFLLKRLPMEYPAYFALKVAQDRAMFECRLSGETLVFDNQLQLTGVEGTPPQHAYRDALDALCCQIQEDFSITQLEDKRDHITYLHLCLPNYWAAEDKIGKCFVGAHVPVPAMEKMIAQAKSLIDALARNNLFERFTWGLTTDARLNHHPIPPPGRDPAVWKGRRFDPATPALYLRTERQVTIGLPEVGALVFTIRTYLRDVKTLDRGEIDRLIFSLRSMAPEIATYKGIADDREAILHWLENLNE